jgi:wobble nucleotide-excising tRNase
MSTIEEIEKAVENLAPRELARFRAWFEDFDAARFDEKIERDANTDKLDALAKQALEDHRGGGSREL